jgi:hypothetical protein
MNKLTREEFEDRIGAIQRASRIFIESGLTNNITTAFRIYQEVLSDREREIELSTQAQGNRPRTHMDDYERPECPDCGADMLFRGVPKNANKIQTQLVCSNPECDLVLNSEKSIPEWEMELRKKDEN